MVNKWWVTHKVAFCAVICSANTPVFAIAQNSQPQIELAETWCFSIPDTIQITGASVSPYGEVVSWTSDKPGVLIMREGAIPHLLGQDVIASPLVASFTDHSTIEVFDMVLSAIVRIEIDSGDQYIRDIALPVQPTVAAYSDGWWYFGGVGESNDYLVYAFSPDSVLQVLATWPFEYDGQHMMDPYHISAVDSLVIVASREMPFDVVVVSRNAYEIARWRWMPAMNESDQTYYTRDLIAMPIVPIRSAFIQVFSDLRSDYRLVQLRDRGGSLFSTVPIDAPFGLVSSAPETGVVLGIRRLPTAELVLYQTHAVRQKPASRRSQCQSL